MILLATLATLVATNVASFNAIIGSKPADTLWFHLEGRVTYIRHAEVGGMFALADDSGATMLSHAKDLAQSLQDISPGNRLAVDVRMFRNYASSVQADAVSVTKLDSRQEYHVDRIGSTQFHSGAYDYKVVRIEGILRDVFRSETCDAWVLLTIISGQELVIASTPANEAEAARLRKLIGSRISEEGLVCPGTRTTRRHVGKVLLCKGMESTVVLADGTVNPFARPDIRELRGVHPRNMTTLDRHRAEGRVLAITSSGEILMRTRANDIATLRLLDGPPPPCGKVIEAVGFPKSDLLNISLDQAVWRPSPAGMPDSPPPVPVTPDLIIMSGDGVRLLSFNLHGQPVRTTGIVKNIPPADGKESKVYLESQGHLILLDAVSNANATSWFALGSEVEVTGILSLISDDWSAHKLFPQIRGYSVILRTREDVRLVRPPPFWTASRLYAAFAFLLLALTALVFKRQSDRAKAALLVYERTRLAVELHDSLAQNLTGVSMELEAGHLPIASKMLDSCRNELRNCLWDLRSQALDNKTMNETIRTTLLPQLGKRPANIRFCVDKKRLSQQLVHMLMRVIRELVINAIRHGKADKLRIAGIVDNGQLRCSVTDDGVGFDPEAVPGVLQGHFGLEGIRERLATFNGRLSIQSKPGKGTRAVISIPLPNHE